MPPFVDIKILVLNITLFPHLVVEPVLTVQHISTSVFPTQSRVTSICVEYICEIKVRWSATTTLQPRGPLQGTMLSLPLGPSSTE